ncbi:MAG: hypothetical protein IJ493_11495 [Clostridia bacterium]|nr:hypothetical protein [Clostridia bacterium]
MGFGLLFIGYFFFLNLPMRGIDILPDFVGCLLMLSALRSLTRHCPSNQGFARARTVTLGMGVLSLANLFTQIAGLSANVPDIFTRVLAICYSLVVLVWHIFLLMGIYELALAVDLPKLAGRTRRILTLTVIYYVLQLLSSSGLLKLITGMTETPEMALSLINLALYLLGLVWLFCTAALIFTCYMRICLEGDEDMPEHEDLYDKTMSWIKSKKK